MVYHRNTDGTAALGGDQITPRCPHEVQRMDDKQLEFHYLQLRASNTAWKPLKILLLCWSEKLLSSAFSFPSFLFCIDVLLGCLSWNQTDSDLHPCWNAKLKK